MRGAVVDVQGRMAAAMRSWPRPFRTRPAQPHRPPTSAGSAHSPPSGAAAAQPPPPSADELQQLVDTLQNDQAAGTADSATADADRRRSATPSPRIGGRCSAWPLVQPDRRLHRRAVGRRAMVVDAPWLIAGRASRSPIRRTRAAGARCCWLGARLWRSRGGRGGTALDHRAVCGPNSRCVRRDTRADAGALCRAGFDPRPGAAIWVFAAIAMAPSRWRSTH